MKYIGQFTFLRFLAAALVVVFHFGKGAFPFDQGVLKELVSEGSIAVSFFFFLSGMVLGIRYMNDGTLRFRSFMLKRLARIYPTYLLAFVAALVLMMVFKNAYPRGLSIILQALSLHAWVPGSCLAINFPGWSISVEMFLYLMFPLLVVPFRRLSLTNATVATLALWAVSGVLHVLTSKFLYRPNAPAIAQFILYFPPWHLNTFVFGMLGARFIQEKQLTERPSSVLSKVLYVAGTLLFVGILTTQNQVRPYTHNGLLSPIYFMVLVGLAADRSLLTHLLAAKPLELLGNASYALYIFQWPVYLVFEQVVPDEALGNGRFYLYFLVLTLTSVASYLLFEKRMKRLILSRWSSK